MKNVYRVLVGMLALLGVAAGSYWMGARNAQPVAASDTVKAERKLLYYRNPMGLPDTSPLPKKDAMGMDYVPVYEGDAGTDGVISIASDRVQKLGVQSEAAALRVLERKVRAVGRIEIDERRTYTIAPKFEGWVERLYANSTGQAVVKGQPLFEVYSPELVSAQREHALALQGVADMKDAEAKDSMKRLADASAARLRNWDVAGASGGKTLTFRAPVSGIVLEKKAVEGVRFMPGEMLYQIADLSSVWVMVDVAEQDIAAIKLGDAVQVAVDAWPEQRFTGKVDFIYPTLSSATRTVSLRVSIPNPQGKLKPAMFASVELATGKSDKTLTVPASAVIDSGARQIVLVRLAEGRFAPRAVRLGRRGDGYVEVQAGVAEGEQVVTSANFLIDAESNLRAALGGFGGQAIPVEPAPESATQEEDRAQSVPSVPRKKSVAVGHAGQGILNSINPDGTASIKHEPIASLGWPGMTMDFELANSSLGEGIKPGSRVTFELVERAKGEWVITRLQEAPQDHTAHQHEGH